MARQSKTEALRLELEASRASGRFYQEENTALRRKIDECEVREIRHKHKIEDLRQSLQDATAEPDMALHVREALAPLADLTARVCPKCRFLTPGTEIRHDGGGRFGCKACDSVYTGLEFARAYQEKVSEIVTKLLVSRG